MDQKPQKTEDLNAKKWSLVSLATELGFIIAIPVVLLGLGGKWLDARMGNQTPWFTLLGIILAIVATSIWITKKLRPFIK